MAKLQFKKSACGVDWLDKQAYSDFLQSLPEGQIVDVVLKPRKSKTNQQLAYYYAVMLPACVQGLKDCGYNSLSDIEVKFQFPMVIDEDECDKFLKQMFAHVNKLIQPPLKRRMTIFEMSMFIEWVLDFMATQLNVTVEAPKEI